MLSSCLYSFSLMLYMASAANNMLDLRREFKYTIPTSNVYLPSPWRRKLMSFLISMALFCFPGYFSYLIHLLTKWTPGTFAQSTFLIFTFPSKVSIRWSVYRVSHSNSWCIDYFLQLSHLCALLSMCCTCLVQIEVSFLHFSHKWKHLIVGPFIPHSLTPATSSIIPKTPIGT